MDLFREKLVRSILLTMAANYGFQLALFGAAALAWGFAEAYFPAFALASLGFHGLVAAGLVALRAHFVIEGREERLARVNLANRITLVRVCALPTILFLILAARAAPVLPYLLAVTALAFLTDLLDGKLSRALGQVTSMGRMLDSTSDYCLLIVITVAFLMFGLIPAWLFGLVLFRLVTHAAMMVALAIALGRIETESSFLGKASVAALMVLYAGEILRPILAQRIALGEWNLAFSLLEWAAAAIIAASIVDKAILLRRAFARIARERRG